MAKKKAVRRAEQPEAADQQTKKVRKAEPVPAQDLRKVVSAGLRGVISQLRAESGSSRILAAGEFGAGIIGLPTPFVFECLTNVSVLPFGYVMGIIGKQGCNKSAMLYELMRWFGQHSGGACIVENESKKSYDLDETIIGHVQSLDDQWWWTAVTGDVEAWQKVILDAFDGVRSHMVGKQGGKGIGRIYPFIVGLDSLMGKLSRDSQANIDDDGFASRSSSAHGYEANIITQFFKKLPQDMENWPFFMAYVNHLKRKTVRAGSISHEVDSLAGGAHMEFQHAICLKLRKVTSNTLLDKYHEYGFDVGSNSIEMRIAKNSWAPDNRVITVDLIWWNQRDDDGVIRQRSVWDWNSALTNFLLSFDGERQKRIKQIVNIQKQRGNQYHCLDLGVPTAAPVAADEIGRLISEHAEIKDGLRNLFGIKRLGVFKPGVDYLAQKKAREDEFLKRLKS